MSDSETLEQLDKKAEKLYQPGNTPEDIAAQFFFLYHHRFTNYVNKLSNGQLRRLINALVKFPLEKEDYQPKNENEREAFNIGDRLLSSKYVMQIHVLSQNMHEQKEKAAEMEQSVDDFFKKNKVNDNGEVLEVSMDAVEKLEKEKQNG